MYDRTASRPTRWVPAMTTLASCLAHASVVRAGTCRGTDSSVTAADRLPLDMRPSPSVLGVFAYRITAQTADASSMVRSAKSPDDRHALPHITPRIRVVYPRNLEGARPAAAA